jgi:hypothetical protein
MFAFFPEDGTGDCALAAALKTHTNAKVKAARMSLVFMIEGARLVESASHTIPKIRRGTLWDLGLISRRKRRTSNAQRPISKLEIEPALLSLFAPVRNH